MAADAVAETTLELTCKLARHLAGCQGTANAPHPGFDHCKIVSSYPESYNATTARHLWDLSLQFVGLPAMIRFR